MGIGQNHWVSYPKSGVLSMKTNKIYGKIIKIRKQGAILFRGKIYSLILHPDYEKTAFNRKRYE